MKIINVSWHRVSISKYKNRLLPIILNKRDSDYFRNNTSYLRCDYLHSLNNHRSFLHHIANKRAILVNYIRTISGHTGGRLSTSYVLYGVAIGQ